MCPLHKTQVKWLSGVKVKVTGVWTAVSFKAKGVGLVVHQSTIVS
jgi:hypothetical protein